MIGNDIHFKIRLSFLKEVVTITHFCLLFYDNMQTRIAIYDTRPILKDITKFDKDSMVIEFKIPKFNLIENEYQVGIYLQADGFIGDIYDIIKIKVNSNINFKIRPYESMYRGFVELSDYYEV